MAGRHNGVLMLAAWRPSDLPIWWPGVWWYCDLAVWRPAGVARASLLKVRRLVALYLCAKRARWWSFFPIKTGQRRDSRQRTPGMCKLIWNRRNKLCSEQELCDCHPFVALSNNLSTHRSASLSQKMTTEEGLLCANSLRALPAGWAGLGEFRPGFGRGWACCAGIATCIRRWGSRFRT